MKYILITLLLLLPALAFTQNKYFVNAAASGTNSGENWQNAFFDLQHALQIAQSGDTVWIAAGAYYPTSDSNRELSFEPVSGLRIFGGFAGTESSPAQRDLSANQTVLSGDIGVQGDSTDNSYNIMYLNQPEVGTILDGLVFRDGNANGLNSVNSRDRKKCGGGLYIMGADGEAYPDIRNCRFEHNTALNFGGGVMVNGAGLGSIAPLFQYCTFNANRCVSAGGGIARLGGSYEERGIDFFHCRFTHNYAGYRGGALYHGDVERKDSLELSYCQFEQNKAENSGGGAFLVMGRSSGAVLKMKNCDYIGNEASDGPAYTMFPAGFETLKIFEMDSCVVSDNVISANVNIGNASIVSIDQLGYPGSSAILRRSLFKHNFSRQAVFFIAIDMRLFKIDKVDFISNNFAEASRAIIFIGNFENSKILNLKICKHKNGVALIVLGQSQTKLANCIFTDNISFDGAFFDFSDNNLVELMLSNSAFYKNNISSINSPSAPFKFNILNSIFDDINRPIKFLASKVSTIVSYSCFDSLTCNPSNSITCTNNLTGIDPMFVDTAAGDYRLQPCSPLVNAGSNALLPGGLTTDYNGAPRIQGGRVDIGPYETPVPSLATEPLSSPACPGALSGALSFDMVNGCAPYAYQWANNHGAAGTNLEHLSEGIYSVTITDARGSSFTANASVSEANNLSFSPVVTPVQCGDTLGGSATVLPVNGYGPYAFIWQDYPFSDSLRSGLPTGNYALMLSDAKGCTAQGTLYVPKQGALDIKVNVQEISCNGMQDGAFYLTASNGKAPFEWAWENGPSTPDYVELGPGTYLGSVKDALGCTLDWIFPLQEPAPIAVEAVLNTATDSVMGNGSIRIDTITGGSGVYGISWSNGQHGLEITGLKPGNYALTLTDSKGCLFTKIYHIGFTTNSTAPNDRLSVQVFPNPASNRLQFRTDQKENLRVELYDLLGRRLRQGYLSGGKGDLDVEFLPAGLYRWVLYVGGRRFAGNVAKK